MPRFSVEAVIFDFDGTILDTEWTQYSTVRDEFLRHGHEYDFADFLHTVGRADQRHWSEVLQDKTGPLDNIEEVKTRRMAAHHEMIGRSPLRDGVISVLDRARDRSKLLGVASSSPSSWVEGHLADRELLDRFGFVATRDYVENGKPWPDVFLLAAEKLQVDPAHCLVIEDSANGVAGAKAAGMTCVAVPNPVTSSSDLSEADLVLETLAELPFSDFDLG